jgi:hypothetical protein
MKKWIYEDCKVFKLFGYSLALQWHDDGPATIVQGNGRIEHSFFFQFSKLRSLATNRIAWSLTLGRIEFTFCKSSQPR